MKKQTVEFGVRIRKGIVQEVGTSTVFQPKVHYNGAGTKWFDDSVLLKKNRKIPE